MRFKDYIYLMLFLSSAYCMYDHYGGKVAYESCLGISLLVLLVIAFITLNIIRALTWLFKYF